MFKTLRNSFIAGIFIILPLTVTLFVIMFLVGKLGTPVTNLIFAPVFEALDIHMPNSPFAAALLDVISTFIVLAAITAVGFLSRFFFGKILIEISEQLINKIPFARTVYKTVKQIVDTFSKQNSAVFQYVVLIECPRRDMFSIGFVTGEPKGETQSQLAENYVNVFIPTTPNPTSGFYVMVPSTDVKRLEMSVSDGMKMLISGGAVAPAWRDFQGTAQDEKDSK